MVIKKKRFNYYKFNKNRQKWKISFQIKKKKCAVKQIKDILKHLKNLVYLKNLIKRL